MKKKITTTELASFIAQREGTSKSSAEAFVRKFFEVIERGLLEDKYVKIKGLGTFKLVVVGERESVNVQTGERFQISGHTKVSFTPDNSLKELVNRPFAHFTAVDLNDDTETEELDAIDQRMAEEYKDLDHSSDEDASDSDAEEEDEESFAEEMEETYETESHVTQVTQEPASGEVAPGPEAESLRTAEAEEAAETPGIEPVFSKEQESEDTDGPEIHTDSPIIPISTGETHHMSPTSTPSIHPAAPVHEVSIKQQEEASEGHEAEDHQAHDDGEKTKETLSTNHEVDDICVSDPHPINHNAGQTAANFSPTTTNSMGYAYSEVPSRKKHNWWKTATIVICALLLMACCYYAGYFRLLCPTCEFSPLLDSWSNNAPSPELKSQTGTRHQPANADQQKDTSNGLGHRQTPQPEDQGQASPQSTDVANNGQSTQAAQADSKTRTEPEKPVQPSSAAPQANAKPSPAASSPTSAPAAQSQSTFHKVKAGENLTRIVRRHYGSEAYVNMVIKRNHLKNADNVTVGTVLELPPKPQVSK